MARVHVLEASGGNVRLVFHITVPAGNNPIGTSWVDAVRFGVLPRTSVMTTGASPGQIASGEATSITNGQVLEVVESVEVPPGFSVAQANGFLDNLHAAKATEMIDRLQGSPTQPGQLRYFGFTRT